MPSVARIIDANFNRAREALRVMEEAARFILNDSQLTQQLKQLRHDLAGAMRSVDAVHFSRDTTGDVGTGISTTAEMNRASAAEVVIAAGNRLSEALRSIEEYGKTIDVALAQTVQFLRYRGYELQQRLDRAMGAGRGRQWRVCVIISQDLCGTRSWSEVAAAALDGGADCIQLREKSLDDASLLDRARALVDMARVRATVIINDRPDIALASGADGVHVGQSDLPCAQVRRIVGRQLLIGVSTSRLSEARQALTDGADYCGVGPMSHSSTKHKGAIAGPAYLREYLEWNMIPHLAIGGITPGNVSQLVDSGCRGVAVSSAVCGADDPTGTVRALVGSFDHARTS